ncbi:MAG: response regulator transcription factor [Ginsengibacter sp.]|jgi:DNA-binding response OmpR family regulator
MENMKILIAEDELLILKTIEMRLKKEGYEVIAVSDGLAALEQIKTNSPDVIILDIMMPFFSGLEIVAEVRQVLKLQVPIIMLSSMGQEDTMVQAFKLGANDYVTKPFSPNELLARIGRYCNL